MFQESFKTFVNTQLNELSNAIIEATGKGYEVRTTINTDFRPNNDNVICANIQFGGHSKIEGSPNTVYQKFAIYVWGELGKNGLYTENIFNLFFEKFSKTSIKLNDGDNTYSIFMDFGDLVILDSHLASGNTYRCKYACTGNIIYSTTAQVGRHTYIAFPTKDNSNPEWYEVHVVTPSEARDNNLTAKSTNLGIAQIRGNKGFSGNLGLIFENDEVSMKLVKYIHGDEEIESLWMKYEYQDYVAIEKKLVIQSVNISLDENTKNTVIAISYVKDDVYGL